MIVIIETTIPIRILKLVTNLFLVCLIAVAIPIESFACHKNNVPHGKNTECDGEPPPPDDSGASLYDLVISNNMNGSGGAWELLGSRTIDYKNFFGDPAYGELNLDYFRNPVGPFLADGVKCFGNFGDGTVELYAANLGKVKGSGAGATFWFWGYTNDGTNTQVLYRAGLKGTFSDSGSWPPATGTLRTLKLTDWLIAVENEGKEIKAVSCLREGKFSDHVKIEVVNSP